MVSRVFDQKQEAYRSRHGYPEFLNFLLAQIPDVLIAGALSYLFSEDGSVRSSIMWVFLALKVTSLVAWLRKSAQLWLIFLVRRKTLAATECDWLRTNDFPLTLNEYREPADYYWDIVADGQRSVGQRLAAMNAYAHEERMHTTGEVQESWRSQLTFNDAMREHARIVFEREREVRKAALRNTEKA